MKSHLVKAFLTFIISVLSIMLLPLQMEAKSFPDTPSMYEKEINYLVDKGIIKGLPNGLFMPNNTLSKAEAALMVARALELNTDNKQTSFVDVPESHYASGGIQSLVQAGIIDATPNFYPAQMITRGEMATLLVRAFQFNTIDNDIYFFDVLESNMLQENIYKLVTAGIVTGYVDGTFKPNATLTRTEFSILTVRALDPSSRQYERVLKKEVKIVNASSLNVRSGPGTGYAVIAKLPQSAEVAIYKIEGNWAKTIINKQVGYVHTDYLREMLIDFKIAIDAGHGGTDPGAVGNGLLEKDINLAVALFAQKELRQLGIEVYMIREDDTYYTRQERVKMSVAQNADAFVSIHTNSAGNEQANGTETYYSLASNTPTRAQKSEKLASFIHERLVDVLGLRDRGVKTGKFDVIHQNPLPSALVELGFIVNKADVQVIGNTNKQQQAGKAIAEGVLDYIDWLEKQ